MKNGKNNISQNMKMDTYMRGVVVAQVGLHITTVM